MTNNVPTYISFSKTRRGEIFQEIFYLIILLCISLYFTIPEGYYQSVLEVIYIIFSLGFCGAIYIVLTYLDKKLTEKELPRATNKTLLEWLKWQKEYGKTNFELAKEIERAWETPYPKVRPLKTPQVLIPCLVGCNYNTTQCLTRNRSYRSPTRRSHNSAFSSNSNDGGGSESDSGDPPCPSHNVSFYLTAISQINELIKCKLTVAYPRLMLLGVLRGWAA